IITWDEHGGFYDHVPPPPAEATGSKGRTHGFTFAQLGPRVPAIVVSPLIPKNLIEHRQFDHCAIPLTVERIFKLKSTGQPRAGNGVNHLVSLSKAREDAPRKIGGEVAAAPRRKLLSEVVLRRPMALVADDRHGNVA